MLVCSALVRRLYGVAGRPRACPLVEPRAAGRALQRCLHQSPVQAAEHPINAITPSNYFESDKKNRETFLEAIELFHEMSMDRRGHVEFILAALEELENFGVHRDLQVYKKLLDIFPRDKMVSRNFWQVALMHYPKQQDCALLVLQKMEDNNVMPDVEMRDQLIATFGKLSYPVRRIARMFYWMPKFRHLSPWPLPDQVPNDALQLAQLAVTRIASVDPRSHVTTYLESDMPTEALDRTWVVSAQSQQQRHLLQHHDADRPLLIEGAFRIWLRDRCVNYFILRAEPTVQDTTQHEGIDSDDLRYLQNWTWQCAGSAGPLVSGSSTGNFLRDTEPDSAHRQSDGTIMAVCATGTSSRDSLLSWIRLMQHQCPRLAQLPILFPMRSPLGDVIPVHQSSMDDSQMTQKQL